jgi:drug/metabolite transporter (DMT)-like permease
LLTRWKRTLRPARLLAALLAIGGAAFVAVKSSDLKLTVTGVLLVQLSNASFAIGQVLYRQLRRQQPDLRDANIFGFLYAGALGVALCAVLLRIDHVNLALNNRQFGTLVYLGVLASGLCFFLWNIGANSRPAPARSPS